jgi:hypothetical protein
LLSLLALRGYRIEPGEVVRAVLQGDGMRNCCVGYDQNKNEITLSYECDKEITPAFIRGKYSDSLPKHTFLDQFLSRAGRATGLIIYCDVGVGESTLIGDRASERNGGSGRNHGHIYRNRKIGLQTNHRDNFCYV